MYRLPRFSHMVWVDPRNRFSDTFPRAPRAGLNPQPSVFKSIDLTTRPCSLIINKKTNRLNVETFSAIQSIRYDLKSTQQDTFSRYRRINFLRSPINQPLCRKMSLSYKTYSQKLEKLRNKRKKSCEDLGVKTVAKKKSISVHHRAEKVMKQVLNPKQKWTIYMFIIYD